MDNQPQVSRPEQPPATQPDAPKRSGVGKTLMLCVMVIVLMAASAGGAYWVRDRSASTTEQEQATTIASLQQAKTDLENQLAGAEVITAEQPDANSTTPCTSQAPGASAIANIEASITSGNTAALEGYMASSVTVILAASEGLGPRTPAEAVGDVTSFISSDQTAWDYDFALPAATLSAYGQGDYAQYFPSIAVVGLASNQQVVSFSFDCSGNIDTVFLASDANLL